MNADKTGKLIKEIRKEKGLTQKELASALHITDKAVSKWETGKSMPDSYLMSELCDKLDISLSELLSGERGSTDAEIKDNIGLIMDLLDREKAQKAKTLNWYFLLGLLFLLPVLFYEHLVLLGFWKAPLQEIDKLGLWIGLGLFFEAAGFYHNSKNSKRKTFSASEMEVLTENEKEIRMKTANEMLQFARKYQKAELRQYKLAFEEIEKDLRPEEYAIFTMVADDYTVNDSPGPWHIALAVTNERVLLGGETVRGQLLTCYVLSHYERSEIASVKMVNRKMVLKILNPPDTWIKIQGEHLEAVLERMRPYLAECTDKSMKNF